MFPPNAYIFVQDTSKWSDVKPIWLRNVPLITCPLLIRRNKTRDKCKGTEERDESWTCVLPLEKIHHNFRDAHPQRNDICDISVGSGFARIRFHPFPEPSRVLLPPRTFIKTFSTSYSSSSSSCWNKRIDESSIPVETIGAGMGEEKFRQRISLDRQSGIWVNPYII